MAERYEHGAAAINEWPKKRTRGVVVDGVYLPENACSRCDGWLPPYKAGVPVESAHLYCWGHENGRSDR